MTRTITIIISLLLILSSCVSKKIYEDLEYKYNRLLNSNSELVENNEDLIVERNKLKSAVKKLQFELGKLEERKKLLENDNNAAKTRLTELIDSYAALESESALELAEKANTIQNLITELEEKENALALENHRLLQLQQQLQARSETIEELEELILAKEAKMLALREAVSDALCAFEGKGLTITNKNGKIYVSMENKLLFDSGSWKVGSQGNVAVVELAKVLVENPDIEVLIEGHTDTVPYKGNVVEDNWDLSVKRATAIVRILQSKHVDPKQITAAGKSEYLPVANNLDAEGRARNRRIEIILAPNLDRINELLKQ